MIELLQGGQVNPNPMLTNTCYSFVTDKDVIHVASVHKFDPEKKTLVPVQGSGGLSSAPNEIEGSFAEAWGRNIWADMLG